MKLLAITLITLAACFSNAATRSEKMYSVFKEYNKRFNNGQYSPNEQLARDFIKVQNDFFTEMTAQNAMTDLLEVSNDYDSSMQVKLFVIKDENSNFLAVAWQQSSYDDVEQESRLRIRTFDQLNSGIDFVYIFSNYAFNLKGFYMKADQGGSLQLKYNKNFSKSDFGVANLFLLKSKNNWNLYKEDKTQISKANVKIWTRAIPPNGGVTSIDFN